MLHIIMAELQKHKMSFAFWIILNFFVYGWVIPGMFNGPTWRVVAGCLLLPFIILGDATKIFKVGDRIYHQYQLEKDSESNE